ncbi:MAG TPA: class I SAM-dependent methyltransferase [Bacteroidales bacterium]|nr:class I SAM-dependent methyltransferase [Bacteroidales bacterium]
MHACPLCFKKDSFSLVKGPDSRVYQKCKQCRLISADPASHQSFEREKERYLTHNNGIEEEGYVNFLNQAVEPALPLLQKGTKGLDFGCGPTPTLSLLLEQQGYTCDIYDPIFFPDMPGEAYDFVFATECFEHFFSPDKEIKYIKGLLKPGGLLIIKTEPWKSTEQFLSWYYAKDKTHVCFYHYQTIEFIAFRYKFEMIDSGNDTVFIMRNEL